jgi:hypothetical protein
MLSHIFLYLACSHHIFCLSGDGDEQTKKNSMALSPQANYTNWATVTCQRNLVPTFVDRGVSHGQRSGAPTVVNEMNRHVTKNCIFNYCVSRHFQLPCFYLKCSISQTAFCLPFQRNRHSWAQSIELVPISRPDRIMENVQKHNKFINTPSPQTSRFYRVNVWHWTNIYSISERIWCTVHVQIEMQFYEKLQMFKLTYSTSHPLHLYSLSGKGLTLSQTFYSWGYALVMHHMTFCNDLLWW